MFKVQRPLFRLLIAMAMASVLSIGLLVGGAAYQVVGYGYMAWNLFLAWLPLLFILWLLRTLRRKRWSSWQGIGLSVLWLGFLPNSFYMVSDLIHVQEAPDGGVLYTTVMLMSFALNGLLLGYVSLYLFHNELRTRLPRRTARHLVAFVLFLCSFAIYLGRDLRWNTWDVLVNPAGLLFDLSNRLISPFSYPRMFVTTGIFFLLLATLYYVIWNIAAALRDPSTPRKPKSPSPLL